MGVEETKFHQAQRAKHGAKNETGESHKPVVNKNLPPIEVYNGGWNRNLEWVSIEYLDWVSTKYLDRANTENLDRVSTEYLDRLSTEY